LSLTDNNGIHRSSNNRSGGGGDSVSRPMSRHRRNQHRHQHEIGNVGVFNALAAQLACLRIRGGDLAHVRAFPYVNTVDDIDMDIDGSGDGVNGGRHLDDVVGIAGMGGLLEAASSSSASSTSSFFAPLFVSSLFASSDDDNDAPKAEQQQRRQIQGEWEGGLQQSSANSSSKNSGGKGSKRYSVLSEWDCNEDVNFDDFDLSDEDEGGLSDIDDNDGDDNVEIDKEDAGDTSEEASMVKTQIKLSHDELQFYSDHLLMMTGQL
jgi:hypothetical protein